LASLPRISGEQAIRALERLGFVAVRQRGSHVILRKETEAGAVGCSVPLHKELAVGTLRGILKLAKVSTEEFLEKL
jgi:predicted RNA binding protein YcfA (HicA-like mRNA interferase family)